MTRSRTLKRGIRLAALVALATAAGCITPAPQDPNMVATLSSQGDLRQAMSGVTSVSLHPTVRTVHPRPGRSPEELRRVTDTALTLALADLGIQVDPSGRGQRLLAYSIGASSSMTMEETMAMFGISSGVDSWTRHAERGGILLVIVRPTSGAVLWRGGLNAVLDDAPTSQPPRVQLIQGAFARLLEPLAPR
jgi:hypothetical protein